MYDLIILGGGPAGVAAGVYAARKKINTLLLTKDFGGQSVISASIENWIGHKSISGIEFAKMLEEHLRAQEGIEIKDGVAITAIKKTDTGFLAEDSKGNIYESKFLLINLGSGYKKLGVPGEKEYEGKGVFYCSTCDAPLMKGKKAAVVGGGNSGLEAAEDLLPYASEIYLLTRGDVLRGDPIEQEKIKKEEKVKIIYNAEILEIFGDVFANKLKYKDLKTNEEKELEVSGVFVEIGYAPNTALVKDLVKTDEGGNIIVDHKTMKTSYEGVWAAGDVTDTLYDQINPAMGDGVKAALNIYETLQKLGN